MGPVSIPDDIVKSDKVLISWYWVFIWSHRFKIWEVSLQSDWTPSNTIKSHGVTNLRDLRWLIVFWNDSILSGDFFTMTTKYLELCIWIIRSRKWSMSFQLPFCFPILLAYGQIPASGPVYPSWSGVPPFTRKQYRTRGDPALYLSQGRGHLNWRTGLPALLGGNLGCWI